jgi:uncharacterized membrane protein YvbJ
MHCTKCSKELPPGAMNCPYCGATVAMLEALPKNSSPQPATADRKTFCVKCGAELHPQAGFCTKCGATRASVNAQPPQYSVPPGAPIKAMPGQLACPRCGSLNVTKGTIPQWAMIAAIVGFLIVCVFSLFFLMVKDPNRCLNCGYTFK